MEIETLAAELWPSSTIPKEVPVAVRARGAFNVAQIEKSRRKPNMM